MKKQKRGISLIVLVITIIVMIVLASAIIITLSNSNIITKAKEATLKTDVKNFEQELSLALADKKLEDNSFKTQKVDATTLEEIAEYIPSFDEKYLGKLFVQNGEVVYDVSNVTEEEKSILESIGVKAGTKLTPAEIKAIVESKNLEETVSTTDITKYVDGISNSQAEKYTIFEGNLYYRYEKTTYEEQLEIYAAEIPFLVGDYRLFTQISPLEYSDISAPETTVNTELYDDMVAYYPEMTEAQAARFKIVDGQLVYKSEVLTAEEIAWADEYSIPYV